MHRVKETTTLPSTMQEFLASAALKAAADLEAALLRIPEEKIEGILKTAAAGQK